MDPATLRLNWNDPRLVFVVREPFRTRITGIILTAGFLEAGEVLTRVREDILKAAASGQGG